MLPNIPILRPIRHLLSGGLVFGDPVADFKEREAFEVAKVPFRKPRRHLDDFAVIFLLRSRLDGEFGAAVAIPEQLVALDAQAEGSGCGARSFARGAVTGGG